MKRFVFAAIVALIVLFSFNACCGGGCPCKSSASVDTPLEYASIADSLTTKFDGVFTDVRLCGTSEIHSMVVLQNGKCIYERYAEGQRPDYLHILWSASKTFTATAIGFAVQDGLVKVDDKITKYFADEIPAEHAEYLDQVTVWNLLTMSSGFDRDIMSLTEARTCEHPAAVTLESGFLYEPGTSFSYNSMNTYLLSAIVTKVTGKTAEEYLEDKLFKPLGIRDHIWETSVEGYSMGGWGLHITTQSFAKMGQFFLQRGMWNGEQLLDSAWFDQAASKQVDTTPTQSHPEWIPGYGYQMWMCSIPGSHRLDGAWGQFSIIMPDKNLVVAINAHAGDPGAIITSVFKHVYGNL